jgi:hypothetical protein
MKLRSLTLENVYTRFRPDLENQMKRKPPKLLLVLQCQLVFLFLAPVVSGQIRLHDPANDELAKKTREAFAEFSKGDANVFETMVGNTLTLREATLSQLYELSREGTKATVNRIPLWTWKRLREEVRKTQGDFLTAYLAARGILKLEGVEVQNLKQALALAQADLKTAKDERAKKADELEKTEQPKLTKLTESLENLKHALAASSRPVNRLSDLNTEFNNLKTVWTNIQAVKAWWDAAERATNAPGLQLTILDFGVAHQQATVDRLKLDLQEATAKQKRLELIEKRLELAWGTGEQVADEFKEATGGLFGQVYDGIAGVTDDNEQVLQTIGKMAKLAEPEVGTPPTETTKLRNLLDVLGRYVSLDGYQKYLLLSDAIEAGVDVHLFSIRRSALNTKEREVLVGYGLDGLAAYHAGGLRPEQIANFFRAVQTIALGVIAGRD